MLPSSTSVVMKELGIDATCIIVLYYLNRSKWLENISLSNQSSLTLSGWGSYIYMLGLKKKTKYLINISKNFHPTLSMYVLHVLVKLIQLDDS